MNEEIGDKIFKYWEVHLECGLIPPVRWNHVASEIHRPVRDNIVDQVEEQLLSEEDG